MIPVGGAEVSGSSETLNWSIGRNADEVIIALGGEVDLNVEAALAELLDSALDPPPAKLVLDLAQLTFIDSTGIRCVLNASRQSSSVGCRLVVRHPKGTVLRVFEVSGVDALLLDNDAAGDAAKHR